jgi:hypothetical protein
MDLDIHDRKSEERQGSNLQPNILDINALPIKLRPLILVSRRLGI